VDLAPILVIGSSNMDMIVKSARLPRPGETVIGGTFSMVPGGKGANQAVAAARMGGRVHFLTCLGEDEFGRSLVARYNAEGIDTSLIQTISGMHTGVAFILVDASGENLISVASGANALFAAERLEALERLPAVPKWVLLQLEIPLDTVVTAARWAQVRGVNVILDPAPCPREGLPDELLSLVDILTPNAVEAEALAGRPISSDAEAVAAGRALIERGVREVIVTLGERGGVVVSQSGDWTYEAPRVRAIDTTAAGDCFAGALAVGLAEGMAEREAVALAARAAALSVTRMGAQSSLPTRREIR
jgi:ribokinase